MFVCCIHRVQFGLAVIPNLLNQGFRVGRTVSKKFGCELLDEVWNGFYAKTVMQVGGGGMSQKH